MKPALTAEEWAAKQFETEALLGEAVVEIDPEGDVYIFPNTAGAYFHDTDRQRLSALLLYGQPFGFAREDVALLRAVLPQAVTIADRIEALLPPEG